MVFLTQQLQPPRKLLTRHNLAYIVATRTRSRMYKKQKLSLI